jgi:hypothetical protein
VLWMGNPHLPGPMGSLDGYPRGDTNGDLHLLNSLAINFVNVPTPPKSHLSRTFVVDDATLKPRKICLPPLSTRLGTEFLRPSKTPEGSSLER